MPAPSLGRQTKGNYFPLPTIRQSGSFSYVRVAKIFLLSFFFFFSLRDCTADDARPFSLPPSFPVFEEPEKLTGYLSDLFPFPLPFFEVGRR